MKVFDRNDDAELASQLSAFERDPMSQSLVTRADYLDLVLRGGYARHKVRGIQTVIEQGRPWPEVFADAVSLLGHVETYDFRLACGPWPPSRAGFWEVYEESMRELQRALLPDLLETNYVGNIVAGSGYGETRGGSGRSRTQSPVQGLLAREVGGGDLITALKVVFRMMNEGIDGGLPAIRHRLAVDVFRRQMRAAQDAVRRTCLECEERGVLTVDIIRIINQSGATSRQITPLDVAVFWTQYVDAFIDLVAQDALPREFR